MTAPAAGLTQLADSDTGKGSPIGFFVVLVLVIAVYFLYRSLSRHLGRVPESFDQPPAGQAPEVTEQPPGSGTAESATVEPGAVGSATAEPGAAERPLPPAR
ncbi:MAG: hypothetical protein ACR2N4_13125 [Jatrophihabitans sp.]